MGLGGRFAGTGSGSLLACVAPVSDPLARRRAYFTAPFFFLAGVEELHRSHEVRLGPRLRPLPKSPRARHANFFAVKGKGKAFGPSPDGAHAGHHSMDALWEPRRGAPPGAARFELLSPLFFPLPSSSFFLHLSPLLFFSFCLTLSLPLPFILLSTYATETVCPLVAVGALCVPWATGGVIGGNPGLGAHPSN